MKLIDLLVKELPKRGGWPDGALNATQNEDGEVCFSEGSTPVFGLSAWHDGDWCGNEFYTIRASDYDTAIITSEQYEAALEASGGWIEWNGEGLPPVGVECEYSLNSGASWFKCKIDYILGTQGLVMLADVFEGGQWVSFHEYDGKLKFRPLHTEAEKAREAAETAMRTCLAGTGAGITPMAAKGIYNAIAAGKIPGVKLEEK